MTHGNHINTQLSHRTLIMTSCHCISWCSLKATVHWSEASFDAESSQGLTSPYWRVSGKSRTYMHTHLTQGPEGDRDYVNIHTVLSRASYLRVSCWSCTWTLVVLWTRCRSSWAHPARPAGSVSAPSWRCWRFATTSPMILAYPVSDGHTLSVSNIPCQC